MKRIALPCFCFFIVLLLNGCGNQEILARLDVLESQVAQLNKTVENLNVSPEISPAAVETPEPASTCSPEPKRDLSYETVRDLLGKANVMDGMDDRFLDGTISISSEEYFIFLQYDCTLTDEVIDNINRVLQEGYGSQISKMSEGFTGDGDYLSFIEAEDDDTLNIGFELSNIETASKIYQLDMEYFSSYDEFMLKQDTLDEFGIPDPLHVINYNKDGSIFISLDWTLSGAQANQLAVYYAKQLLGVDDFNTVEQNVRFEGVAPDGAKLIFVANDYSNNFEVSIERICKNAQ